jgi:hypothetical protein
MVSVSDRNWTAWTGLSPRAKEYAIAGLRKKCLRVDGRGDTAKYYFERPAWEDFVRAAEPSRPRTAGRKAGVDPKQGAKVHPSCRERGCALLDAERASGLSLVPATANAQPVAQTDVQVGVQNSVHGDSQKATPLLLTQIAQPVAQVAGGIEAAWLQTLAAMRAVFPLVGVAFLVRLLAVVRALFADIDDSQLARAVALAWERKKRFQRSEGLFLATVPEVLGELRRAPKPSPADAGGVGPVGSPGLAKGATALLGRTADLLRGRGAPFREHADRLEKLWRRPPESLDDLDQEMIAAETAIAETASGVLNDAERATVEQCVAEELRVYKDRMNKVQLETLRAQLWRRWLFETLGLPRLSLLYVS